MFSRPLWWRLCAVAAIAAVATGGWLALTRETTDSDTPAPAQDSMATPTSTTSPIACLRDWEGRLAVFSPNGNAPIEVYDVFTSSLPPSEKKAIQEGVLVYSETELQRLLEDYTG